MEKATIIALLEKYWQAETTVEEEKALADWFHSQPAGSLDSGLEPYAALFGYFEEESRVTPGKDFEARILRAIGAVDTTASVSSTPIRDFRWGLISAAAVVFAVVASLFLFQPAKTTHPPDTVAVVVKDTYDDPEQALAAVRHALLIASAHLNEGRKQISNK